MDTDDLFQRIDTTVLYPPFRAKLVELVQNCQARGVAYWAISGYRSVEEQNALFALGRTVQNKDGLSTAKPFGNIVTKARGGQSTHNFAIATDFCKDKDMKRSGLQPDWDLPSYLILAEEATKLDLEPGYFWKFKDAPHVQLPLSKHGILLFPDPKQPGAPNLLDVHAKGGMKAVFAFLDQYKF